jgi:hypothetical protein
MIIDNNSKSLSGGNSVVTNSSKSSGTTNKYFCSYCNTRLVPLTQEYMVGGYVCTKCTIDYRPNQTPFKKADKLDQLQIHTVL